MKLPSSDLRFHLERPAWQLGALIALAALLAVGASVGIASIAGFDAVRTRLAHPDWPWLVASAGGMLAAFAGYRLAYQGISDMRGGPDLERRELDAVVAAGFGGFVARGGAAVDNYVMRATGADRRSAEVRVGTL